MEENFIPYKQALALKELGFNEPCFGWFWGDMSGGLHIEYIARNVDPYVSAPLYQQAFKWFRDIHSLCSHVRMYNGEFTFEINEVEFVLQNKKTYEEAETACLNKLIEVVCKEK